MVLLMDSSHAMNQTGTANSVYKYIAKCNLKEGDHLNKCCEFE